MANSDIRGSPKSDLPRLNTGFIIFGQIFFKMSFYESNNKAECH